MSLHRRAVVRPARRLNPPAPTNPSKRHRFPGEILSHWVWRYFRFCFCLSYRNVSKS